MSEHIPHDPSSNTSATNDLMHQHQSSDTAVRESVKNEPEDYINEEEDMLGPQQQQNLSQHQQPPIAAEDIKLDGFAGDDGGGCADYTLPGDSVSISSRSQAAMQQLQDTFSTFIPGMTGQNSAFLQHSNPSGGEHARPHPSFSLEGVQGKGLTQKLHR